MELDVGGNERVFLIVNGLNELPDNEERDILGLLGLCNRLPKVRVVLKSQKTRALTDSMGMFKSILFHSENHETIEQIRQKDHGADSQFKFRLRSLRHRNPLSVTQ